MYSGNTFGMRSLFEIYTSSLLNVGIINDSRSLEAYLIYLTNSLYPLLVILVLPPQPFIINLPHCYSESLTVLDNLIKGIKLYISVWFILFSIIHFKVLSCYTL